MSDFPGDDVCITHHFACDCIEQKRALVLQVLDGAAEEEHNRAEFLVARLKRIMGTSEIGATAYELAKEAIELAEERFPKRWTEAGSEQLSRCYANEDRTCRVCGCSEIQGCFDEKRGRPCSWIEEDLCSSCEGPPSPEVTLDMVEPEDAGEARPEGASTPE